MFIEIRVRGFYTGEGGNAVPGVTLLAEIDEGTITPLNLGDVVDELKEAVDGLMMRPMSEEEVKAYREREEAEEGEGFDVVNLD